MAGEPQKRWPGISTFLSKICAEPSVLPDLVRQDFTAKKPNQLWFGDITYVRTADGWWLASDNPAAGAVDSRRFGAVPVPLIEGRVLFRYWRPR